MYSLANYSLIDARIDDLHRAAQPAGGSYVSGTIARWTAALRALLKPKIQVALVQRHAH